MQLPEIQYETRSDAPFNSHVFYVLASRYCRYVLYVFILSSEPSMELDDLTERVEFIRVHTEHPSVGAREQLSSTLINITLPRLAAIGAIDYDSRTQTIRYHPSPTLEEYAHHSAYQELPSDLLESERP
jgi:hypothetical protein